MNMNITIYRMADSLKYFTAVQLERTDNPRTLRVLAQRAESLVETVINTPITLTVVAFD